MAETPNPSEIARETLRRLAVRRLQPTPDNFLTLYYEVAGTPAIETFPEKSFKALLSALPRATPDQLRLAHQLEAAATNKDWSAVGLALASAIPARSESALNLAPVIRDLFTEYERHHTGFTVAKKREALEHVLTASGRDPDQLIQRLHSLARSWSLAPLGDAATSIDPQSAGDRPAGGAAASEPPTAGGVAAIRELVALVLDNSVSVLLIDTPDLAKEAQDLARDIRRADDRTELEAITARVKKFVYRLQWIAEDQSELRAALLHILQLIIENISELVMDDQWLHGQVAVIGDIFSQPIDIRRLDDVGRRLKDVIVKQSNLKKSLTEVRERLKLLLARFVDHLAGFSETTGDYHQKIEQYAARISSASDISELSDVVEEVMRETRQIQFAALHSRDELRDLKGRVEEAEREVVRLQAELANASELVRRDQLTGALNRKGLEEALEQEIARSRRRCSSLCISLLDIDDFKKLNDTLGHKAGDDALSHLAKVITETLRPQDTVGRYGGEEFVILLPDTELEDAVVALTRLQRELTKRFFLHNNDRVLITFSAGVTALSEDDTGDQALQRADSAMYRSKRAGKNRVTAS